MTTARRRLILAGGGSGGHLFPGLAVAEAARQLDPDIEVLFLATGRDIDRHILSAAGWPFQSQPVRPLPRRPGAVLPFIRAWRRSVAQCRAALAQADGTVVLGLGGFASGPALQVAAQRRIAAGLLNPDAVPGRANRFALRKVQAIYLQWDASRRHFGRHAGRCVTTGCPLRRAIVRAERAAAVAALGLRADRRTLVFMGGSQGGHNVNEAALAALADAGLAAVLRDGWQLVHLAGTDDFQAVRDRYAQGGMAANVLPFTDRMDAVLAAADLVVNRAGASTLAELTATGTPSILLPYPYHRDQHQRHNAEVLAEAGAAMIVTDTCDATRTGAELARALYRCLSEPSLRAEMAEAAGRLARPDAAAAVVRHLLDLPQP